MGVQVDKTGRDPVPGRVDFPAVGRQRFFAQLSHPRHVTIGDQEICRAVDAL
jgi:hypothetical protein